VKCHLKIYGLVEKSNGFFSNHGVFARFDAKQNLKISGTGKIKTGMKHVTF
jgi:hypothetical protein